MPDPATTRRQKLEKRESAILDAATSVIREKGFHGATITEIATRADIAEGTLYLYFRNKNDLMRAVVADHWGRITAAAQASVADIDGSFDRLEALAGHHLNVLIRDWPLIELSYALFTSLQNTGEESADFKRAYIAAFNQIFARGVDRGDFRADISLTIARDLFFGALEYSARTAVFRSDRSALDQTVRELMTILRSGLAQPDGKGPAAPHDGDLSSVVTRLEAVAEKLER